MEKKAAGKIIRIEEYRQKCQPSVKWLYDELFATPFGKEIIRALIQATGELRERRA